MGRSCFCKVTVDHFDCYLDADGANIASRMNREVHVRIWERPEVRALRATQQEETFGSLTQRARPGLIPCRRPPQTRRNRYTPPRLPDHRVQAGDAAPTDKSSAAPSREGLQQAARRRAQFRHVARDPGELG